MQPKQLVPKIELDRDREKEITVVIGLDGCLTAVHDDKLEWETILGGFSITRASKREYNNNTKQWEATIGETVVASDINKNKCDILECQYLNRTNLAILEERP